MEDAGRWVDDPILPEVSAPPPERVLVRGAQLIRVINVDAPNRASRKGFTEAVILAWARLPDGDWAVLAAWQGAWQQHGHTTGLARCGWVRLLTDRVQAMPIPPVSGLIDGAQWHGHHELSQFAEAVRQAALLLPEDQREAALTPRHQ